MCHQFLIMKTKRCVTISKETHTYCGPKRTILYFSDSLGSFLLGNNQRSKFQAKKKWLAAMESWSSEVPFCIPPHCFTQWNCQCFDKQKEKWSLNLQKSYLCMKTCILVSSVVIDTKLQTIINHCTHKIILDNCLIYASKLFCHFRYKRGI